MMNLPMAPSPAAPGALSPNEIVAPSHDLTLGVRLPATGTLLGGSR